MNAFEKASGSNERACLWEQFEKYGVLSKNLLV